MAELKYYVQSKDTGNVYGPLSAGDRGNMLARGYKDVTAEHSDRGGEQAPATDQPPAVEQPAPAGQAVPASQPQQGRQRPPRPDTSAPAAAAQPAAGETVTG